MYIAHGKGDEMLNIEKCRYEGEHRSAVCVCVIVFVLYLFAAECLLACVAHGLLQV